MKAKIWGEKSQKSKETIIVEFKFAGSAVAGFLRLSHYEVHGVPSMRAFISGKVHLAGAWVNDHNVVANLAGKRV